MVVQQQDGSYDWELNSNESGAETQAFMAEVDNESVLSEELVQMIVGEEQEATVTRNEVEKETEVVETEIRENDESTKKGESVVDKNDFLLNITEDMELEEVIGYMADIKAPDNHKVLFDLKLLVEICSACDKLSGKVNGLVEMNISLSNQLSEYNKLKEENAFLKHHVLDLKNKLKEDEKDLRALNSKVNEQIQIIELARDTVAEKVKEISEKQKELAESQLKTVELNKKLDNFQNSQFKVNRLLNSQRVAGDVTGLGYNNVPPPFNDNYSFVNSDDKLIFVTSSASETDPDTMQVPKISKSGEDASSQAVTSNQSLTKVDKIQKVPESTVSMGVNS